MNNRTPTGAAMVAGVVGAPIRHSLSPLLHNAWIAAAGLDAVYAPFAPPEDGFGDLVQGLRRGVIRGLNVTAPFKTEALALGDEIDPAAEAAGAANLLLFQSDGRIIARNTDGIGLLYAFQQQAPDWRPEAGAIAIIGAGGAARGAAAALKAAGAGDVRIINRTRERAESLAAILGLAGFGFEDKTTALKDVSTLINTASGGFDLGGWFAHGAHVAMDMVYSPLKTPFLAAAEAAGLNIVDGLDMLIGQARPSFAAFYGQPPPEIDVRALALAELARRK
jgi:shikimate dehydrogenase